MIHSDTGFRRMLQTDADGRFAFAHLQPGSYRLEVTTPGFRCCAGNHRGMAARRRSMSC